MLDSFIDLAVDDGILDFGVLMMVLVPKVVQQ